MGNIGHLSGSCDGALSNSLSAIRQAHDQLHHLTSMCTTATVLASQIELCDVLLVEISGIRSSLANDLKHTREGPRAVNQMVLNA